MGAPTADRLDQAGRLRVVEEDHVAGAHERGEFSGVPGGGLAIRLHVGRPEPLAVTR